jgi:hypothetical protein
MTTTSLKTLTILAALSLHTLSTPAVAALTGGDSGGGGDALEGKVNEIRADLLNWIQQGGAKELTLPASLSYGDYADNMKDILANKKVALSFTYEKVTVGGAEKTCRGKVVTANNGLFKESKTYPQILCNITRFKDTPETKLYPLIHHEYAGLVNVEKNDGSASDYEISNQLTDFLEDKIVKRLAVKKRPEPAAKRDSSLEGLQVKDIDTFNPQETLAECRPYHDQLIKENKESFDNQVLTDNGLAIKEYYRKNGLNEVEKTNLISKRITKTDESRTTLTYIFDVVAGSDSTQMKFEMNITGEYKTKYSGTITNYVDKLGRIKSRELYCSIRLDIEYKGFDPYEYEALKPIVKTKLTNMESGYEIKEGREGDRVRNLYYQAIYQGRAKVTKAL